MIMMRVSIVVCILFLVGTNAFSADRNRVFVGTPVSNFPKHLVADRMTQNPKILHPEESVDDAIHALVKWGVSGAPVVSSDDGKTLLGVVSAFDFLQKEAFEGVLLDIEGSTEHVTSYIQAAKRIIGQQVQDIMTIDPRTVSPNTPMRIAAEIMAREQMHHLPVVDDHGNLVGILTPSDVMKDLVHVVRNLPPAPKDE